MRKARSRRINNSVVFSVHNAIKAAPNAAITVDPKVGVKRIWGEERQSTTKDDESSHLAIDAYWPLSLQRLRDQGK
jgi:hypothetical protein